MLSAILKTQHVLLPDCKGEGMSEIYINFITDRVEYLHVKSLYQLCDQYSSQSLMNENPNLWYHLLFIPTMGSVILSTNLLSIINRYMSCICITSVGMKKHEFNFINVWVKIVYRIPIFNLYNSRLIIYWYRGWEQKVLSRHGHRFRHMWAVCVCPWWPQFWRIHSWTLQNDFVTSHKIPKSNDNIHEKLMLA